MSLVSDRVDALGPLLSGIETRGDVTDVGRLSVVHQIFRKLDSEGSEVPVLELTEGDVGELGIGGVFPGLVGLVESRHEISSEGGSGSEEGRLGVLGLEGSSESVDDGGEQEGVIVRLTELLVLLEEDGGEDSTEVESGNSPLSVLGRGDDSLELVEDIDSVDEDILESLEDEGSGVLNAVKHLDHGLSLSGVGSASGH